MRWGCLRVFLIFLPLSIPMPPSFPVLPMDRLPPEALQRVAGYFQALAEPMRLELLNALRGGERSVGELARLVGTSTANASRHLALMAQRGLVSRTARGTSVYCAIADDTVYGLDDIQNTTAQLAANGIGNYMELTEAAGNLNAVAGGNADSFKSVAMMLTQTAGAGKLTTENWNQLADAIPGARYLELEAAHLSNREQPARFTEALLDFLGGDAQQPGNQHRHAGLNAGHDHQEDIRAAEHPAG